MENMLRNCNKYANAMLSATSLAPIEIEDEDTILIIKNFGKLSYIDYYFLSQFYENCCTILYEQIMLILN